MFNSFYIDFSKWLWHNDKHREATGTKTTQTDYLSSNTQKDSNTMKLVQAIATERPRRVNTRYGEKYVIDCLNRENGETFSLWRPATDSYTEKYIIKNSPLTVGLDGKGRYSLIEDPNLISLGQPLPDSPVPVRPLHNTNHVITQTSEKPNDSDQSSLSPNQKKEIAQYIQEMAKLYGFCLTQADSLGVIGEDRRAIATTLYLSAQKKFAL